MESELIQTLWGEWRIWRNISTQAFNVPTVLRIRIRDPVTFRPRVPERVKKSRSGPGMNIPDHISESLETIF
jgi:hypothetical protein